MRDLNDYEKMKIMENLKQEFIGTHDIIVHPIEIFLITYVGNCKLVYGKKYPDGHDWTIHFSPVFDINMGDMGYMGYMAWVIVYTSRDSLRDREVAVNTRSYPTKEEAVQDLITYMSNEVTKCFDDLR